MRRVVVSLLLVMVLSLGFAAAVSAKEGIRATLTSQLPRHAAHGQRLAISWTLRDRAGHPFNAEGVFVKLICPTKDAYTTTFASGGPHVDGRYRVVATVPPGGLGSIVIGLRGSTDIFFPITNNPLRKTR